MKLGNLTAAIVEAERFIASARAVEKETLGAVTRVKEYTKECAACRRASMDLTRALARLRREQ